MNEEHKALLLNVVENRHFEMMFDEIKLEIAMKMIETTDLTALASLRDDVIALGRLHDKLVETANDVRMGD